MSDEAKAKTKAAPAKKAQQAPKRQEAPKLLGLRTWEPGAVAEAPRADPRADGGRPLDPWVRASMESRFGHDFGRIRIHTGPEAAREASTLGAHAYTLGLNVYFGAGHYRPALPAGQKLIAHELEHVVRAGPAGPAIPMLQPDPAADHEKNLRLILAAKKSVTAVRAGFAKYIKDHPGSAEVAERLLLSGVVGPQETIKLLGKLFTADPASKDRIAEPLRKKTADLRAKATDTTSEMLKNYEAAAFASAMVQWAAKRRDEEKAKRPKPPRPPRGQKAPPPELTSEEKQFEAWRVEAQARLDALATDRKALLSASSSALEAMVKAAEPIPYVQGDVLESLADKAHGMVDEARRIRIRTFADVSLVTLEKSPSVTRKLAAGESAVAAAKAAEEAAREKRMKLDPPAIAGVVPAGPDTKAQTARKKAADKVLAAAVARREKAEKAITLEGVRDPELKSFLQSQDPTIRGEAEDRLKEARKVRESKLAGILPTATQEPGLSLATLLDDKQLWWIYHTALNNIGSGFGSFSHEHTLLGLVTQRSAVSKNREALGVDSNISVGTYHGHGEGQYDINAAAGKEIKAVQPDQVDLSRVLNDRSASGTPRFFDRVSTKVLSFSEIDATDGDEDVLAKLAYGFFGRSWKDRDKMAEFLAGVRGKAIPKPAPDASRIVAGLVFENTITGSPPSEAVKKARDDVREKLETALHTELRKLTPSVDIPDTVKILATLDASEEKQYGGVHMITEDAYSVFFKIPGKGKAKSAYTRDKARNEIFKAVNSIVLADATVNVPLEKLLSDLLAKGKGNRSGPHVTLIHHYKEAGTGKEAWIEVDYRHLLEVAALKKGDTVNSEDVIGKVGSSGNAISPHIHMAIRVYETNPQTDRKASPIGYLMPLDFFPFDRPGAKPKP